MRAVIAGHFYFDDIGSCAAYFGVGRYEVIEALYGMRTIDGMKVRTAPDKQRGAPAVSKARPLLASGYCVHRLGVYSGGRY